VKGPDVNRPLELETLEPRLLLSADEAASGVASWHVQPVVVEVVSASGLGEEDPNWTREVAPEDFLPKVAEPVTASVAEDRLAFSLEQSEDRTSGRGQITEALGCVSLAPAAAASEIAIPTGLEPATTNPFPQQLTETLRAANGPLDVQANGRESGVEFIDRDILADPKLALLDGLLALGNWGKNVDNVAQFAVNLPIVDRSIGTALDIGGILLTRLRDPVLTAIRYKVATDGQLITFQATAVDADGAAQVFSLGPGAPTMASITPGGLFTWTPIEAQAGQTYQVKIFVADNNLPSLIDAETILINVALYPAPSVLARSINNGLTQRSRVTIVSLQFTENVVPSLTTADILLRKLTTSTTVAGGSMSLSYDALTNSASLTFPGLAGQQLAEGRYELTLLGSGVADALGKSMAVDCKFNFHVLTGDANGDAVTNDLDLCVVWQNSLKPLAQQNPNANVDGNGVANNADIKVVKSNYLMTLPLAPPGSPIIPPLSTGSLEVPAEDPDSPTAVPKGESHQLSGVIPREQSSVPVLFGVLPESLTPLGGGASVAGKNPTQTLLEVNLASSVLQNRMESWQTSGFLMLLWHGGSFGENLATGDEMPTRRKPWTLGKANQLVYDGPEPFESIDRAASIAGHLREFGQGIMFASTTHQQIAQ